MKILCENAQGNNSGKIICMVGGNPQPCKFQRYCTQKCEWQNTGSFSTCERRNKMARTKSVPALTNENIVENLEIKAEEIKDDATKNTEVAIDETVTNDAKIVEEKIETKNLLRGKVVSLGLTGVAVKHLGNNYFVEGVKANIGDWIDFEPK